MQQNRLLRSTFLLAFLLTVGPAVADVFEYGQAAFVARDYDAAAELLLPLAEGGHPVAQLYVGVMYAAGNGVAKDYARAYAWLHIAAAQKRLDWSAAEGLRDLVGSVMTYEQVNDARALSIDLAGAMDKALVERLEDLEKARRLRAETMDLLDLVARGHYRRAALLVSAGVDLERRDGAGRTPLMVALWNGRSRIARLLIERGAGVNAADADGNTPLLIVTSYGVFACGLEEVAGQGDLFTLTPLLRDFMLRWANHEIAELLIASGADPHAENTEGLSPVPNMVATARCLQAGTGSIPGDPKSAVVWYRLAADHGDATTREAMLKILSELGTAD